MKQNRNAVHNFTSCVSNIYLYWTHIEKKNENKANIKTHPKEGIQRAILHELSDYHNGAAFCHHALQVDDVGVIKLTHDAGFTQEVPPLLLSVARLQRFNSYQDLSFPRKAQVSATHFPKLTCRTIRGCTWLLRTFSRTFCLIQILKR